MEEKEEQKEQEDDNPLTTEIIDEVTRKVYAMLLRDIQIEHERQRLFERHNRPRRY